MQLNFFIFDLIIYFINIILLFYIYIFFKSYNLENYCSLYFLLF